MKSADRELARIQSYVLDAMAPLSTLLEEGDHDPSVVNALTAAVQLIGNASANISHLRRQKVVKAVNENLTPLVEEESVFRDAPPLLCGKEFTRRAKEHVDEIKAMRSSLAKKPAQQKPFFRGTPHSNSRGGGTPSYRPYRGSSSRGRGQWQRPHYQPPHNQPPRYQPPPGQRNKNK